MIGNGSRSTYMERGKEGRRREWLEYAGIFKAESLHCGVMAAWLFLFPKMILLQV